MQWMNTNNGYGIVARGLHILLAVLILGQLSVGFWMVGLPDELKASIYGNHKTFGLFILGFVVIRMTWRLFNVIPQLPYGTPYWQALSARSLHRLFYVMMLALPITGWMMSTAAGYLPSLPFLGKVAFPFFTEDLWCALGQCFSRDHIGGISHDAHAYLGIGLVLLIVFHTGIAIWHAYLKDGVFERMFVDRT